MDKKQLELIEKCRCEDAYAKEWVYKKYAPVLLGICLRYINDRTDAEDVLQESFITIYSKIKQLKNATAFESWIKRIVINNSLKYLKSKQHLFNFDEIDETTINNDNTQANKSIKDRILGSEISQEQMISVVNSLPPGFRTVFNLYVFEKLKHNEIAKELGISVGTSKSQLLRARKLIQKNLYELVLEKEYSKKGERVMLTSFIVFMEDDLGYIDKLAHSKLSNYATNPILHYESILNATVSTSKMGSLGYSKIASLLSKKAFWYSTIAISTSVIAVVMVSNSNTTTNTIIKQEPPTIEVINSVVDKDTCNNTLNSTEQTINSSLIKEKEFNTEEPKPKAVDSVYKKVYIKKAIKIKKKKIIVDTVRRTDTLLMR